MFHRGAVALPPRGDSLTAIQRQLSVALSYRTGVYRGASASPRPGGDTQLNSSILNTYINPDTPLKLADFYNISGVFSLDTISPNPKPGLAFRGTSVLGLALHDYVEFIFQNNEDTMQSWHLDGHSFWTVGFGSKQWTPDLRSKYNLEDATSRSTVQVYPRSWTAILASLDNKGMWNLRSAIWPRRYLGQELYLRAWNDEPSLLTENVMPDNALKCGKAGNL